MNKLCYGLLNGTLSSPVTGTQTLGTFNNNLPIPVRLSWVPVPISQWPLMSSGYDQLVVPPVIVKPGASWPCNSWNVPSDSYFAATVPGTGALIDVFQAAAPFVSLWPQMISMPNDAGPIPIPTSSVGASSIIPQPAVPVADSTVLVPPDSPRVMVGCGITPNGNYITREQYWERQGDSVCLAGNEARTVSFTITQGKQETSSKTETVSASLSSSISAGWGPVSASISASLSMNSTSFQQVTVTEQTTSYVSHTIRNPHDEPVMYLRWQLTDVITIFQGPPPLNPPVGTPSEGTPLASVIMAESPIIVAGPYWTTPPQHPKGEGSKGMKAGLLEYLWQRT